MATRKELKAAIGERYRLAVGRERRQILEEFVRITGYHRKHALRILNQMPKTVPPRARGRLYDEAVLQALTLLWEAGDRICGKRLKALIPVLVEAMERRGYLQLDPTVKNRLLRISAATIDRLLQPLRRASGPARRRRWGMGSAIKQSVPVRTFADWGEPPPGYCEADLVEHCGGAKEGGNYVHSLTLTDIHSGWTECAALVVREQSLVVQGIEAIAQRLPFTLRGLDTDNDSAFMNETLQAYCGEHQLEWTRSRAYCKNDQAWVEQKNGAVVRRLAGYERLSGLKTAASLARLYASARDYVNFFQPSFKLASKRRDGGFVHKSYHPPRTPYQRLLVSAALDETAKRQLSQHFATLDPVALLKSIRETQQELAALCGGNELPISANGDLTAFLESLATAWQGQYRAPRRRKMTTTVRWWRTRTDPFEHSWPLVERWLGAEPNLTGKELIGRLREQLSDLYPTGAQLRTLQRRVKSWRAEWARQLVFATTASRETSAVIDQMSSGPMKFE